MRGSRRSRAAERFQPPPPGVAEAVDRTAPVERTWLDETSWVDLWRGIVPEPGPVFAAVLGGAQWHEMRTRLDDGRWVDAPRLRGELPGDSFAAEVLRRVGLVIEARYRARFGRFGLLQYRDGGDGIGMHRDRELRYLESTISAGLSLGDTRPFCLRGRFGGEEHHFDLASGDAYIMGGRCQADWMHGVPKVEHAEPKISVIWRWSSKRGRPEPRPER